MAAIESSSQTVAIIIPVFNRALFVRRCLESVLQQTHKRFVAIVVDDGSTDSSPLEIAKCANKDTRIVSLRQPNQGVSSARNAAIRYIQEHFSPDWVCCLDSDDYLEPEFLKTMIEIGLRHQKDIVIGNFKAFKAGHVLSHVSEKESEHTDTPLDLLFALTDHKLFPVLWAKLYRASLFLDHYFDERCIMSEDYEYLCGVFYRSNGAFFSSYGGYIYQTGDDHVSITKGRMSPCHMISDALANIAMINEVRTFSAAMHPEALEQNIFNNFSVHLFGLYGRCKPADLEDALREQYFQIKTFENENRVIRRARPKTRGGRVLRILYLYLRPAFYLVYRAHRWRD